MRSSSPLIRALGCGFLFLVAAAVVYSPLSQTQAQNAAPNTPQASPKNIKLESVLVWGTNDDKSPNPDHKAVDGPLKKKFEAMPLKYKSYFEVQRSAFSIGTNEYTRVEIDKACKMDVKDLGGSRVKVKFYAKNGELRRHEQVLPNGETLIFGGDDKNDNSQSAWFIVIRHPLTAKPTSQEPVSPAVAKPAPPAPK